MTVIIDINDFNHHIPWHNFHAKTDFRIFFSFKRRVKYSYDHWNIWSILKEVWALHQSLTELEVDWGYLRPPRCQDQRLWRARQGRKQPKQKKNILENSAFSAYRTNHHPRKYKKDIYYNNRNINTKRKI